jgi:hypothetical protein
VAANWELPLNRGEKNGIGLIQFDARRTPWVQSEVRRKKPIDSILPKTQVEWFSPNPAIAFYLR